jgi:hypothetical protein
MQLLDPSEYSVYKRNGDFVFIINCNRKKIIADEFGNQHSISPDSPNGIFTEFKGFMTLEITPEDIPLNWTGTLGNGTTIQPIRAILKFPQSAETGKGLTPGDIYGNELYNQEWRKQYYTFSGGSIYSISKFNGTVYMGSDAADNDNAMKKGVPPPADKEYYSLYDHVNIPNTLEPTRDTGVIITNDVTDIVSGNEQYEMINNVTTTVDGHTYKLFGGNWLNLCAYLPQFGYVVNGYAYVKDWRSNTNFQNWLYNKYTYFFENNNQPIAGGQFNTKWFARTDLHWTDFVQVSKEDIIEMNKCNKGFKNIDISGYALKGKYRNGQTSCPYNGGKSNGSLAGAQDPLYYFYKGFGGANCIEYLIFLGIV